LADHAPRTWPALDLTRRADGDAIGSSPSVADRLALVFDDVGVLAVDDDTPGRWRVYLHDDAARQMARAALEAVFGPVLGIEPVDVPDEGWAVKVQQALGPVRVGRVVVSPPWDTGGPAAAGADVSVVIEPSMGFGTGHHQSTRLCLELLQALPLEGRHVLDVGTGSGVLAIAAAKLGAAGVTAIDHDEDAVRAAVENAERNGAGVSARVADLGASTMPAADVVLANLTAITLRRFRVELMRLVAESGVLVVSGFTHDQAPLVQESLAPLVVVTRVDEDDWVALALRRTLAHP
jgi:ribosomal protein L11 methyltransferase